jgi:uncharacterized membrane-anchored protein
MRKFLLDHFSLICISMASFLAEPALVAAQEVSYNPVNFSEPLILSRGELRPDYQGAVYLDADERCRLMIAEWGHTAEDCAATDAMLLGPVPGVDTLIVAKPNSEGFIKGDDWDTSSAEAIDAIWTALVEGVREQGRLLGQKIEPIGWQVRPAYIRDRGYLFYSYIVDWDGKRTINAKAALFDRRGYVQFSIVPASSHASALEVREMTEQALRLYKAKEGVSYAEFTSGDTVAATGAVGVLAALTGVKYGKGATVGLLAVLAAMAKKLWFLLLLPFVYLKRLFTRKPSKAEPRAAQDDDVIPQDTESARSPEDRPPA